MVYFQSYTRTKLHISVYTFSVVSFYIFDCWATEVHIILSATDSTDAIDQSFSMARVDFNSIIDFDSK